MKTRILTTMLALFAIATAAQAQFGGGDGSEENPYIISTTDHWTELANKVNGGNYYEYSYFRLDADLDFTGKTYTIIADYNVHKDMNRCFAGKFNGNGHTIKGVTLNRTSTVDNSMFIGLFGSIGSRAIVENLTLSNSTIKGRISVGGIVGRMRSFMAVNPDLRIVVRNCHVTSDVTIETVNFPYGDGWQASGNVGGIVGYNESDRGVVLDCTSAATIKASSNSQNVGGIVGLAGNGGTISGCAYTGSISSEGPGYVGGILGQNNGIYGNSATVTDNYVGGNCTIGAVGVEGSLQGTDEGYSVTRIYSASINKALVDEGSIDTPPFKTIDGIYYYTPGSVVTLSGLYTSGNPAGAGSVWGYRANKGSSIDSDHAPLLPQGDGTWQFTMPAADVTINPFGARSFDYDTYIQFASREVPYTGEAQRPTITRVLSHGYTLAEGVGYITDIPSEGFTAVGKHPIRIWGVGLYSGLHTDTFTITRAPLTGLTLSETTFYHDGAVHKPTLTVKAGSKTLAEGTDYETDLPAEGFTELGDYIIKVWGIGNYTDTLSATCTICHPWQGMGTDREPFLIQNTDDMDRLASLVNGGRDYAGVYFEQTADLDYAGKTYTPVGKFPYIFNGTFVCYNDYKFLNVSIAEMDAGIFSTIGEEGVVRNVVLSGVSTVEGRWSGGIAAYNNGTIDYCSVDTATVVIKGDVAGGIAGVNNGYLLANVCKATVTYGGRFFLGGTDAVGGLVGQNVGNDDPNSGIGVVNGNFNGSVTVLTCGGGLVGQNMRAAQVSGEMRGSIVTPSNGTMFVGGVVGLNQSGSKVEDCLSDHLMADATGTNSGAIVGLNETSGVVERCYYIGACRYGGINGADVLGQAMRGWPIIVEDPIGFSPDYSTATMPPGVHYNDKSANTNYYYVGAGETLRFILTGGTTYEANGTPLTPAGYIDAWQTDYYEMTMPAQPVLITPQGYTLTLDDNWVNNHNVADIAAAHGQVRSVIIRERTFYKTGHWNTLCLPFNLDDFTGTPLEGATVKTLTSSSYANGTLTLNFTTATTIEAGKPYLVKWASGDNIENPVFSGVTICNTLAPTVTDCVDFIGSYDIEYLTAYDRTVLYLGGDSKLYYPTDNMPVNAFRGYFQLKNGLTAGDLPNSAKNFVLNFGDETTEIGASLNDNGQWINDNFYSIDGRKLQGKPTKKGIYIRNGKKIVK